MPKKLTTRNHLLYSEIYTYGQVQESCWTLLDCKYSKNPYLERRFLELVQRMLATVLHSLRAWRSKAKLSSSLKTKIILCSVHYLNWIVLLDFILIQETVAYLLQ